MLRELAATLRRKPRDVGLGPAYAVSQAARTAWFAGQYLLAARLTPPPNGPLPITAHLSGRPRRKRPSGPAAANHERACRKSAT